MVEPRASTGGVLIIIMIGCITLAVGIALVVLFTFTCTAIGKQELPTPMPNCVTL